MTAIPSVEFCPGNPIDAPFLYDCEVGAALRKVEALQKTLESSYGLAVSRYRELAAIIDRFDPLSLKDFSYQIWYVDADGNGHWRGVPPPVPSGLGVA